MVSIRFGNGVTAMVGSAGGNTWAKNAYGYYMKAKPMPTTAPTEARLAIQQNMRICSQTWADLPKGLKIAWTNYAEQNPQPNRLGESIVLTGIAMFNKVNGILLLINENIKTTPPPNVEVEGMVVTAVDAHVTSPGPGTLEIEVNFTPATLSANTKILARVTGQLNPGLTNVESLYRVAGVSPVSAPDGQTFALPAYMQDYAIGDRYSARFQTVDIRNGRLSVAFDFIGLVTGT